MVADRQDTVKADPPDQTYSLTQFFRAWAWKREHRPDRDRFHRPYAHTVKVGETQRKLTIHQQPFSTEGFASTVWDSSIVLSKYFEKHAGCYAGKKCVDLSAGCGLVGCVLGALGAHVTLTDLPGNLALLQRNCRANGLDACRVEAAVWGEGMEHLQPPFDVVATCDVMYIDDAVPALVATIASLSAAHTEVLVAHGRNRCAAPRFMAVCAHMFDVCVVPSSELDRRFCCSDVDVLRLRLQSRALTSDA